MNLILCESHEVGAGGLVTVTGTRAAHIRGVLGARCGDTVRIGVVDGPKGPGEIVAVDDTQVVLRSEFGTDVPAPPAIDLLLALPRPKVLRRLWAQLAALGVGRIALTNASRVERDYFDTHVIEESTYRPLLLEGLQQAGDTRLPRVSIHRQFRILVEDELDAWSADAMRLVAHSGSHRPLLTVAGGSPRRRVLLAIGPEGGWNDFELNLMTGRGFEVVSLGPRILRTDTACVALLALLHEALRSE
ncbi:MAG: RsmE family RNA methyltransferase [Vicinamibacteraceae bacterium]